VKLKQQLQGLIVQPPTQSGSFTQRCYPSVCLSVRLFVYLPPVCRLQRVLLQAAGAYRVGQSDSSDLLSPMHSGKLHSLVEFSFPLCIKPATTGSATIRRRSWRSSQVLHNRGTLSWVVQSMQCLSLDENRRRTATKVAGSWQSRTGDSRCLLSQLVACLVHSGKLNWTELNSTELNWTASFSSTELSSVQFSFPLYIGL